MALWAVVVGEGADLPLHRKWWHYVVIAASVLTSVAVALAFAARVPAVPRVLTVENTYSLTLLHFALGRSGRTSLTEFRQLEGALGELTPSGAVRVLPEPAAAENVVCETPARFMAHEDVILDGVRYLPIDDVPHQAGGELRHCAATTFYERESADGLAVFLPSAEFDRRQAARRVIVGVVTAAMWFLLYWNFYYRAIIPIYARHRAKQYRRHHEQYGW